MSVPIESLIDDWLEGCLSDTDEQRLQNWVDENPDHMTRLVEATIRDQMLQDVVRTVIVTEESLHEVPARVGSTDAVAKSHPAGRRKFRLAGAVVAIAAMILTAIFLVGPNQRSGIGLEILADSDAIVDGFDRSPRIGERLTLSKLRLHSGSLEVLLNTGVRVAFIAPVEAEFISDMRLHLHEGRISADVGERGKGFTVVTDAGEVIDLGTRFGVEADRNGESRVAVFSGAVELHPNTSSSARNVVTLTEGEALRFTARGGLRRWQQVAMAVDRAGLSGTSHSEIISDVRDNLGEGELRPFYGVIANGMKSGALAFTDKPNPVWMKLPDREFPRELEGADLVRTYFRFKRKKDYELTLSLSAPAEVFVLLVTPGDAPSWLEERFQQTGSKLRSGTWHSGLASHPAVVAEAKRNYLHYTVWKCEAGPGELKLGAPRDSDNDAVEPLMYGVVVKGKTE